MEITLRAGGISATPENLSVTVPAALVADIPPYAPEKTLTTEGHRGMKLTIRNCEVGRTAEHG